MPDETSEQRPPRVTEMVHRWVEEILGEGEIAIDATAGNGHDTAFLAEWVGAQGQVHAFDVQTVALQKTRERLALLADAAPCQLHYSGHEDMREVLPKEFANKVGAVLFNFGYLPGGDHQLITRPETSVRALGVALSLLRSGGILTAVIYPDHEGGEKEARAIEQFFQSATPRPFRRYPAPEDYQRGPIAFALTETKNPPHPDRQNEGG